MKVPALKTIEIHNMPLLVLRGSILECTMEGKKKYSEIISDMIKRSDVGDIVFEILAKHCSNSVVLYRF